MGRRVFAASLAALAEAGLAFLIVAEVAAEGANATVGPLLIYTLFLALFVGGVVLGLRLRGIRAYAAGALGVGVALALLQGLAWGHGDVLGVSLLVVVIVGSGWLLARILYVPAYGIFHLLHINLAGLRALAERLHDLAVHPARGRGSGKDWLVRLAGFAFLASVGYLLARTTGRWLR